MGRGLVGVVLGESKSKRENGDQQVGQLTIFFLLEPLHAKHLGGVDLYCKLPQLHCFHEFCDLILQETNAIYECQKVSTHKMQTNLTQFWTLQYCLPFLSLHSATMWDEPRTYWVDCRSTCPRTKASNWHSKSSQVMWYSLAWISFYIVNVTAAETIKSKWK